MSHIYVIGAIRYWRWGNCQFRPFPHQMFAFRNHHAEVCLKSSINPQANDQIAAIIHTARDKILLRFVDVQRQLGTCDCGLFAITFATALAYDVQPESLLFDKRQMRSPVQLLHEGTNVNVSNT